MTYCSNCGKEIIDGSKYCSHCGSEIRIAPSTIPEEPKIFYNGKIYKCPNCGEVLESFVTSCPSCKYELRNATIASYVHNFSVELEKVNDVEKRIELIKNFYIPNTKEDIYEFFILAYSNISVGGKEDEAWLTKLEQTYLKAKLTFGDTKEFERLKGMYESVDKNKLKKQIQKKKKNIGKLLFFIGLGITLFFFVSMPIFSPFGIVLTIIGIVLWIVLNIKENRKGRK